ncbi:MAG TPA: outer membrane beta-barrel protein [Syntrophales bacterium]|nr:outer membrane beta-barrel protein [Syntrophales bacterium]HOL58647.1 outer membrane beta-barrel protein [Syntrophales bacterium]HPO35065.1 outer membrane beta-barrel protein [Syntrophales bacterium]
MKNYPEAKKWVAEAEKYALFPAKTAFLKGIILAAEGKAEEAVASFEKAKSLDKSYAQAADLQIGLTYIGARKYDQARERLQAAITQDPVSDLATFARRYQDLVEQRSFLERPLRFTISLLGQYDTNMLQEPYAWPMLGDMGEEKSYAMTNTFRVDFVPRLSGPWLFNATYALVSNIHQKNATSHDLLANTLSVSPGYSFGRVALNLLATYTHVLRRNPSYERYVEMSEVGPLLRFIVSENQLAELFSGYTKKNYFTTPLAPEEDQSSHGGSGYVSYTFFFRGGALANVKYRYADERAEGDNWANEAHTFTLNTIFPLFKSLRAQLGGEVTIQDYKNTHTFFGEKRRDRLYTAMLGLVYDINRYVSLTAQYQYTRGYSNIFLYDYNRNLWSAGVEFRF